MSKFKNLRSRLDRIPHLNLHRDFDLEKLQSELAEIDPVLFQPYRTIFGRYRELLAKNWEGICLTSTDGGLHTNLTEISYGNREPFQYSAVAISSPYMRSLIEHFAGQAGRVRLMRINPRGHLAWHRHGVASATLDDGGDGQPDNYDLIVHIPIKTNPLFSYEVIDIQEYQTCDFSNNRPVVHAANYPAGTAWVFNGAHVHNVYNRHESEARYSIMLDLDLRNKQTFETVAEAVERYSGPFLTELQTGNLALNGENRTRF